MLTIALALIMALLGAKILELELITLALIIRNSAIIALLMVCMVYFATTFIAKGKVSGALVGWTFSLVFTVISVFHVVTLTLSLKEAPFFLIPISILVDKAWGISDMFKNKKKNKSIAEKS